ncbi:TonB-dependent receptor domain-containing protein, partial [Helicobacter rodentium]
MKKLAWCALACAMSVVAYSQETQNHSIVVKHTNSSMLTPTQVNYVDILGKDSLLNSGDIANSFLQIPGFSVAKKGGGGTEVFYRSQGAGRLPIFVNGSNLNGGCGGRMDTTLTYVFPQNYNSVTLIKGPQDVRYGTMSAGGILFDRETLRLKNTNFNFSADGLVGSFNRLDFNTYLSIGNELGSLQGIYSDYSRDDYKDGAGQRVHSEYQRRSGTIVGTLTPTETSALELSADIGRGEAAYADRAMDARTFDRESYQLRFQNYFDKDLLDLRAYYNSIDHIMDNYSLTNGKPKIGNLYSLSNPKRTNSGVKAEYQKVLETAKLYFGGDYDKDKHKTRASTGQTTRDGAEAALRTNYQPNYTFDSYGIYAQGEWYMGAESGVFAGIREDYVETTAHRLDKERKQYATSAFARYEHYLRDSTLYAGLGIADRIPDFWEVSKVDGMNLSKETNTQLDIGLSHQKEGLSVNMSGFVSYVQDYILLDYTKPQTRSFNTNAFLSGAEAEASYEFMPNLFAEAMVSYTYGENTKENKPLAQVAPLSSRIALKYDDQKMFLKCEWYANAKQTRSDEGYGNVIGKDFGDSSGFGILNLYAGLRYQEWQVLMGLENL